MIDYKTEGIFGFPTLRYFFYCIALPVCFISFGLLLKIALKYMDGVEVNEIKMVKKGFSFASWSFLMVGGFFMAHTLWPMTKDFDATIYYIACGVCAGILSIGLFWLNKFMYWSEKRFKVAFSKMYNFSNTVAPEKFVPEENKKQYFDSFDGMIDEIEL
jgi:hypothetical protein